MVTFLFLFWTLSSVFLTLNVFRPFASRKSSSFPAILISFALGWLVGDLLPQWILLNFGILLLFSFSDIFYQPLGWGGLVFHLSGWIILCLRLWVILNLPERLDQKMEEQLGNIWLKILPNNHPPDSILGVDWYSCLNPNNAVEEDPRTEIGR